MRKMSYIITLMNGEK